MLQLEVGTPDLLPTAWAHSLEGGLYNREPPAEGITPGVASQLSELCRTRRDRSLRRDPSPYRTSRGGDGRFAEGQVTSKEEHTIIILGSDSDTRTDWTP